MTIFDVLTLIGGLSLFLFGMNIMGQALERRAGAKLSSILGKLTSGKLAGFLTGLGVTAVIQSSSATTVMVVGFVNSGLMSLRQAINVIMGANVGTTVTAWILSLAGIDSGNIFIKLLKPTSFTPVLALVGIVFYMFCKSSKKKDVGTVLLGFATLMFGMDTMSGAVAGLADVPAFQNIFIMFKNPILGMLAGAVLTAIIQSSSASVGILQALAITGQVSYGAAIPIIMGQNIGTCVTAMLSSVGANKNAKRAAVVHLSFNVIGTVVWLIVFSIVKAIFAPAMLDAPASLAGIAISHSAFNILCTLLLLPMSGLLEKLANAIVPAAKTEEKQSMLDDRLLTTPPIALERCRVLTADMARIAVEAFRESLSSLKEYTPALAEKIREAEDETDNYEDALGTYLVKLSSLQIGDAESAEAAKLLRVIGDFERISDHSVNIIESIEEMREKEFAFSEEAQRELKVLSGAVNEILSLSLNAFVDGDVHAASMVEPLEQVIDELKEKLRANHIRRMQQGGCTIEAGFVWSDLLTNLERTSDHCSNIAGCVIDTMQGDLNLHESLRQMRRDSSDFTLEYSNFSKKYAI
ncbi:MAG: Na/Pi cotransporter family protein [Ruminococcaceae bacterium]|nr:Na/Pi cotransporter family protein [Oscillospiraceae bacterium]